MKAERILPIYRVFDREKNLRFFRDILGMRVLLEDGPMVSLGGHRVQETRLSLEETPKGNYQPPADRIKKHRRTVLFAPAQEVQALFEKNTVISPITYDGAEGFSAVSPDGDEFWLIESGAFKQGQSQGNTALELSDFAVAEVRLSVDSIEKAAQDLAIIAEISEAFKLTFEQQATTKPDYVWDIEALQIRLPKEVDFGQLSGRFSDFTPYLDTKGGILSAALPEGLELWFEK